MSEVITQDPEPVSTEEEIPSVSGTVDSDNADGLGGTFIDFTEESPTEEQEGFLGDAAESD